VVDFSIKHATIFIGKPNLTIAGGTIRSAWPQRQVWGSNRAVFFFLIRSQNEYLKEVCMRGKSIIKWATLLAALVLVLTLVGARWAGAETLAGEAIDWWVQAGGGGSASQGSISLDDTLGQPIIGDSSAVGVTLGAGFWYGARAQYDIYLPMIRR
jgi:hypothetical protein